MVTEAAIYVENFKLGVIQSGMVCADVGEGKRTWCEPDQGVDHAPPPAAVCRDHAGGNSAMARNVPNIEIYGGDSRVDSITNKVAHGDVIKIGNLKVECLFTPCHTSGHICYYLTGEDITPVVFTGDTLFFGGCGRFFEGTAPQMYKALLEVLGSLPEDTWVFCGHEYTSANLKYALHVEPNNTDIKEKLTWAQMQDKVGEFTVPSTIGLEKKVNPFMRVNEPSVQQHAKAVGDHIKTMDYLRKEKNNFSG